MSVSVLVRMFIYMLVTVFVSMFRGVLKFIYMFMSMFGGVLMLIYMVMSVPMMVFMRMTISVHMLVLVSMHMLVFVLMLMLMSMYMPVHIRRELLFSVYLYPVMYSGNAGFLYLFRFDQGIRQAGVIHFGKEFLAFIFAQKIKKRGGKHIARSSHSQIKI